jgi:sensor histidine kinase YesM
MGDFGALLRPGGRAAKIWIYALAFSFMSLAGSFMTTISFGDYLSAYGIYWKGLIGSAAIVGTASLLEWTWPRMNAILGLAIAVVAGCILAQFLYLEMHPLLFEPIAAKDYWYQFSFVRGPMLSWLFAAAAWYVIHNADRRAAELHHAELAAGEIEASSAEARLQALQAQVEPHFLFNTLAHVKWLYRRDPQAGRRMLERFLDYLRAALPRMRAAAPTLEEEIALAHAYLDIQQLRIGQRLEFGIDVPPEVARASFPPMMLITLVENAIKHGIGPKLDGGTIRIAASVHEGSLRVEVRDTGAGLRQAGGSGIGLANVRARLAALFGARARLVIEPNLPSGVVAAIEIPR